MCPYNEVAEMNDRLLFAVNEGKWEMVQRSVSRFRDFRPHSGAARIQKADSSLDWEHTEARRSFNSENTEGKQSMDCGNTESIQSLACQHIKGRQNLDREHTESRQKLDCGSTECGQSSKICKSTSRWLLLYGLEALRQLQKLPIS